MDDDESRDTLVGNDYVNMPLPQLATHPDYSNHALRVVSRVLEMTTKELEQLDILPHKRGL